MARREINIAPNISQVVDGATIVGFRVYAREPDPQTGKSRKIAIRFGPDRTLEQLEAYRDARQVAAAEPAPEAAGFTADARRYLTLEDVKAMPSIKSRTREIEKWIAIFGERPRATIDRNAINDALHGLRTTYAASTVNLYRTALMSLWSTLDGRGVPNPVRDTVVFEEPALIPRGISYELLTRILDAIPDERGLTIDRRTLYREIWIEPATVVAARYGISSTFLARLCARLQIPRPPRGHWTKPAGERPAAPPLFRGARGQAPELLKSRARLEVLAFTGMDPLQLARMTEADFSVVEAWYIPPARRKGRRRRGAAPAAAVRLPMTPDAQAAFARLVAVEGLGAFNGGSLLHTWQRACRKVEQAIRDDEDPRFEMPHIRLKDLRHSFGTKVYQDTGGDLNTVARMLGHAPGSPMTIRYSLGAVPEVLRTQMQKFTTPARRKVAQLVPALGVGKAKKRAKVVPMTRKP